jgi:prepilin-type N-terminal cleavage/methylation domain-containing protein
MVLLVQVQQSMKSGKSMNVSKHPQQHGFTLIELLIVISIIGILSGFLFVNFAGVRERGRDTTRKNDLRQLKTALRLYYNDYQTYPTHTVPGFAIRGCGPEGDQGCSWGTPFTANNTNYMQLPMDPLNVDYYTYRYFQTNSGEGFQMCVALENASDIQAQESRVKCGITDSAQAPCDINDSLIFPKLYMECSQ